MTSTSKITVGVEAPDFTLPAADGSMVSLIQFRGKQNVVLYFYPKDNTPGCTAQSCSFRDHYQVFKDYGAEVIGISGDDTSSHQGFADTYQLPFILVSDRHNKVRKAYQVPSTLGLIPGRVTYVIDTSGIIRHIFNSQMNPTQHIDEALAVLKQLAPTAH
jgi:thioredoxin-dependent peroxiredoxin